MQLCLSPAYQLYLQPLSFYNHQRMAYLEHLPNSLVLILNRNQESQETYHLQIVVVALESMLSSLSILDVEELIAVVVVFFEWFLFELELFVEQGI
ncbi:hypothetical protein HanLR1_Chr17g0670071 [Helianthus annuus]|nr:hypothetical protein HanHA89_Chr17g0711511 [Helianthus annuus]KAJ0632874.1 hypothetical protein HanLR1_Chr17g0670071 [Helianthus annuus]